MSGRRLLGAALLVAGTIVLAPLLYAAGRGLFAGSDEGERRMQSIALLAAYRDHWPPPVWLVSIDFEGPIRECGYNSETLFVPSQPRETWRAGQWTPEEGYRDLWMVRSRDWRQRLDELRLARLDAETSAFSSEFLRACIRQSLFASSCAGQVRAILAADDLDTTNGDAWPRNRPRPDQSRQNRNICAYLDGIAARRGLPLATRPQ